MAKTCLCGCGYPVFSNGYSKGCQWKRTDAKKPKPLTNKSPIKKSKKKHIKNSSNKRIEENILYEQAKINVRKQLQEDDKWKCFFTQIEISTENPYWHHLLGKEGELLYTEKNIRPTSNQAHTDYHHRDVIYLLEKTIWYVDFINRVYIDYPEVFAIESRRMIKSGCGLLYLRKYFGELVNEIHKH